MLKNKVLIVDDCEPTLKFMKEFLLDLGIPECMILESCDPMRALELFNHNKDNIELVISDNYMPHSSGVEFCEVVKNNNTKTITVLFSGDTNLINHDIPHVDHILMKPDGLNLLESILLEEKVKSMPKKSEPIIEKPIEQLELGAEFVEINDESESLKGLLISRAEDGCSLALPIKKDFIQDDKIYSLQLKDCQLDVGQKVSARTVKVQFIDEELAKVHFKFVA